MLAVHDRPDPLIGQEVLGYRITRIIGSGGMGAVYEAHHPSIKQRAAIKVLYPEFSQKETDVRRFVLEARAASQVQHPGLVKIFNHGQMSDGTAYIMMEYLEGESLRQRIERINKNEERSDLRFVLHFARQVASTLTAVHKQGIVHRDLKPGNIIIVPSSNAGEDEQVKIVDFGIAKMDSSAVTEVAQTTVGRFLGTALYASPEQCQMSGNIDAKADVYSFGVVLYELLAGRPPFSSSHAGVVIGMHLFQKPRPLWQLAPGTPASLCRLVHEMLEKEPNRRPEMPQVAARLVQISPTSAPMRRFLVGTSLQAVLALALLLLLAGLGIYWRRTTAPVPDPAASPKAEPIAATAGSAVVPEPATPDRTALPGASASPPLVPTVEPQRRETKTSGRPVKTTKATPVRPSSDKRTPPGLNKKEAAQPAASSAAPPQPSEPQPPPAKKRRDTDEDGFY